MVEGLNEGNVSTDFPWRSLKIIRRRDRHEPEVKTDRTCLDAQRARLELEEDENGCKDEANWGARKNKGGPWKKEKKEEGKKIDG